MTVLSSADKNNHPLPIQLKGDWSPLVFVLFGISTHQFNVEGTVAGSPIYTQP